jgi:hypothetical protein
MRSIASAGAGEEEGRFPCVAGEPGSGLECRAGLGPAAAPEQEIAAGRRQRARPAMSLARSMRKTASIA